MVKPSKKSTTATTQPSNPEIEERTRLKRLAIANHQLSATATATAAGFAPLAPAKTVVKHHGKDILKKSQRKNRFLFSFPGLIAPVEGGRIGELTDLGSRNPKLYLEFPQGRMKLLGTIVYPNNRYLTLQFSKGGKNVICDDCFDAMIVFSDAFWIGRKDDNPDEARLDFPEELYKGQHAECNFQGGAGATAMKGHNSNKVIKGPAEQESPGSDLEPESPEKVDKLNSKLDITPARHSERTAGKTFKFAEVSSGDDSANSGSEISGGEEAEDILS
ncbi:hypothetical protein Droror1_Dr00007592 [Drosera rotundifolia]